MMRWLLRTNFTEDIQVVHFRESEKIMKSKPGES